MSRATTIRRQVPRGLTVFLATLMLGLATVVLLSEVFLVGLAERRLRASLAETAAGVHVEIHAKPAIKLLAGRADRVEVDIATVQAGRDRTGDLITRAKRIAEVDVTIGRADLQGLVLENVRVELRDGVATAKAVTKPDAITAVLPRGVRLVQGKRGDGKLSFRVGVAGVRFDADLRVRGGALVVEPDSLLGGVVRYTVWADPRVDVESIDVDGSRKRPRTLSVRARLG